MFWAYEIILLNISMCVSPLTVFQIQDKLIDFHETWYECHAIEICPKITLSCKNGHPIVFWNEKITVNGCQAQLF
jgi:hypothetical protein